MKCLHGHLSEDLNCQGYAQAEQRQGSNALPSLAAVSAVMKLSTACRGGVELESRASLANFTGSRTK